MNNKILLIGDMVSGCKVALSAMEPVLIHKKHQVFCLPTEIVSNTFGYKKVAQVSTGDYIQKAIDAWQRLGFDFDAVYLGYITDEQQAKAIIDYCKALKEKGVKIFHDPIMGEDCHLYYGMGEKEAQIHKDILPLTDYTMPSYTEAAFLTGYDYSDDHVSQSEIEAVIDGLLALGAKNIAITSCVVDGQWAVRGYDRAKDKKFILPYDYVDVKLGGTGDVFSAAVMADVMNGIDFTAAVQGAMNTVCTLILLDKDKEEKLRGINLERYLPEL